MAKETWFDAEETVALGLADRLVEPVRIAARFDIGRFRNAPPVLLEALADPEDEHEPDDGEAEEDSDMDENEVSEAEDEAEEGGAGETGEPAQPGARGAGSDPPGESAGSDPPDPTAIRAEALAHARAVIDLCRLAGLPQMAGSFLAAETSLDEVRAALLAARAETEAEVDPHHPQPGSRAGARPWGEVIARTFKRG
jgi:ATP-dependent Clp protease, protease subunit